MATDEELRRVGEQLRFYGGGIFAGVATNVCHQYVHFFAAPAEGFGEGEAEIGAIDIAPNTFERAEGSELFGYGHIAKVAGMPYLIATIEVVEHCIIEMGVCV